jgi:hypothetical protein
MGPKRSFTESKFKQWGPHINDIVSLAKPLDHQRAENIVEATCNSVFRNSNNTIFNNLHETIHRF